MISAQRREIKTLKGRARKIEEKDKFKDKKKRK